MRDRVGSLADRVEQGSVVLDRQQLVPALAVMLLGVEVDLLKGASWGKSAPTMYSTVSFILRRG